MELVVDFAALDDAESAVRAAVARIEDRLAELARGLRPLSATWVGPAAEAYHGRQRQWDGAAADLVASLTDLHSLVATARHNHAAAVRANTSIWRV